MAADLRTEVLAAIAELASPGRGFQAWLSSSASASLLDLWNDMLAQSIGSEDAYNSCRKAHFGCDFGTYRTPDFAGWLLGLAVMAETLPLALCVADATIAGFPLIYINRKFEEMSGYQRSEVYGRNCRFLQGPDTARQDGQHLLETLRDGSDSQTMMLNYRKNGEIFQNLLTMR